MIEVEEIDPDRPLSQHQQIGWLLAAFTRPAKTMPAVAGEEKANWVLPLLFLTALTLVSVLVAGPLRLQAAQNRGVEPPPNFEYMTPEQQEQYMQAQASMNGPTTAIVFPAIGAVTGLWLSWFLLSALLHLILTLLGSRGNSVSIYNLAAWASLPFVIRLVIQIAAMSINHSLISSPGLSGFINAGDAGLFFYIKNLLSFVDLYLIWQIVLLWLGASAVSGLGRGKTLSGILGAVMLILALSALPGFISAQLGGLNVTRPFIFF